MKKVISLVLVLLMFVTMFPVSTFAKDDISSYLTYEINNGKVMITDCSGLISGRIVIPDTIDGYQVNAIGVFAFDNCGNLESVTIPNSVTTIGSHAFWNCGNLESVTIPNSVTTIGGAAFECCGNLANIIIPNSVTYIGNSAFSYCSSLTSITIPNSVTTIGGSAFSYCKNLTSITIPNSVTSIGNNAFLKCDNLVSVTIGNSVTTIGNSAFSYCNNLTSITIPNSVITIGDSVFYHCDNLKNATIGNSVTRIDYEAFSWCNSLENVTIGNSVKIIDSKAFYDCKSLTSITIPNSVTTIGEHAFESCSNLASVTIGNSVDFIGVYAFESCYNLKTTYYTGTEEQWNNIDIGIDNEYLTNANIIFNSTLPEDPETPENSTAPVTPFSVYFADYLKGYTSNIANVDMPCEALIAAGGMPSLTWNTVVESIKSLTNFKLGIDEKGYYEAILLDLIANTVTSVDYDKEMIETTVEMANMLTNYLVDKNVDVTKEKLDSLDLKNLQSNLQDYLTASNIQITKECFDALIDGTESAAKCIDKISTYAIAMQEGQHLVSALKLMAHHSDNQPLTDCLNELSALMTTTPEKMAKIVTAKETAANTSQVVGDYILGVIKSVFPFETIKDIINIADYGCNLIFPTSTTSEQMYRIYTLYHIEDVTKASFKAASNNYNSNDAIANAENVVSCYDMIVRVYEHQIAECNALAELLYKKGFLNAVKNFFSSNSEYDYQNALDWVDSYNVDLDIIKSYKQTAYEERGLNLGLLQPVRFVGIADGKIMGYSEKYVETGSYMVVPDYKSLNSNKFSQRLGVFEGWFYDEECTTPVWATSILVNKPLVLYSKMSTKNVKQLQVKCPVNVEIFDNEKNLLLKIENDILVKNDADFIVEIEDSKKSILLPDDEDYEIKITATDSGVMNYSVTEIENGIYERRVNFFDVPLYNGQNIFSEINSEDSSYLLTTETSDNNSVAIEPDEILEIGDMQKINVSVNCIGNGEVIGNMFVTQGDYCILEAIPDANAVFAGWYIDDELVLSDTKYSFVVKDNVSISAVFYDKNHIHTEEVILGKSATCTKTGLTDGKKCSVCGEILVEHEEIPATGHTSGEWEVVTEAQIGVDGLEQQKCTVCGEIVDEKVIPALPDYLVGDANGDGKITAADARIALRISAKVDSLEKYNLAAEALDVTGDGKLNAADARKILRIAAQIDFI